MAEDKKREKRSRVDSRKTIDEQFRGKHGEDCTCPTCEEKKEAKRIKAESEVRKKAMAKENRIRKFHSFFSRLKVGLLTFWEAMHDIMSAMLSFVTVVSLVVFLWIAITRAYNGEWIVPLVCLGALIAIGHINERLG